MFLSLWLPNVLLYIVTIKKSDKATCGKRSLFWPVVKGAVHPDGEVTEAGAMAAAHTVSAGEESG